MDGAFPSGKGEGFDMEDDLRTQRKGFRGTAENSKTKICMRWKNGHCRFGDRCNFAHGEQELRKLPPRAGEPFSPGAGRGRGGFGYNSGYPEQGYAGPSQANRGPAPGGYYDNYRGGFPGGYPGGPAGGGAGPSGPGSYGGPARGPALGGDPAVGRSMLNGNNEIWAAQGYPVTGPGGWTQYRTPDSGEPYYHNHRTGQTTWDKPAEWGP